MSEVQDRIRKRLDDFRKTPKGYEAVLRASLALLMVDRLSDPDRPMTQDELATKVRKSPSFISRVIHGRSNCQFKTAAHILCTLGLPAAIYDKAEYDLVPIMKEDESASRTLRVGLPTGHSVEAVFAGASEDASYPISIPA